MLQATKQSSKHLKDGTESSGNFWLKKSIVEIPSTRDRPSKNQRITALASSSSSDSSTSDFTDDLEGYINDLKSLEDISSHANDIKTKLKPKNKAKNAQLTTSITIDNTAEHDNSHFSYSFDKDSDKKLFHGNILTFEDLVNEVHTNQQDTPSSSSMQQSDESSDESSDEVFNAIEKLPNVHLVTDPYEDSLNDDLLESHSLDFYSNRKMEDNTLSEDIGTILEDESVMVEDEIGSISENNGTLSKDVSVSENETILEGDTVSEDKDDKVVSIKDEGPRTVSEVIGDYSMDFESDVSDDDDEDDGDDEEEEEEEEEEIIDQDTISVSLQFPRQPVHLKECSVQTEDTLPLQDPFHSYLNLTPLLLPHVVKPEQIEASTAYTPSSLALQHLVRSQVALAKHLIDHSKRLSDHLTGSLEANHRYTTLDDTKEFIASNKPKVLSYKEAMKIVKKR